MKRLISIAVTILFSISLSACAIHLTKDTGEELIPDNLNAKFGTAPQNLSKHSKCSYQPSVTIINSEPNNNDLVIGLLDDMEARPYIIRPKELNSYIVDYFKEAYSQNMIKSDDDSKKKLEISIVNARIIQGFYNRSAFITLRVNLPEKKKDYVFSSSSGTGWVNSYRALAYAIHETVWKVINDQSIQNYILCK